MLACPVCTAFNSVPPVGMTNSRLFLWNLLGKSTTLFISHKLHTTSQFYTIAYHFTRWIPLFVWKCQPQRVIKCTRWKHLLSSILSTFVSKSSTVINNKEDFEISLTFLPNCQQNCQNSPMQVLTDTTGKNGISEQISSGAWIWPQTEIKSKAHELKPTLFSVWLYFLQATHLTPGVSNTNWSWVPLDVHKDRHVRALWLMWWGAGNLFPGAFRESRREECREPRRAGGFGGFSTSFVLGGSGAARSPDGGRKLPF